MAGTWQLMEGRCQLTLLPAPPLTSCLTACIVHFPGFRRLRQADCHHGTFGVGQDHAAERAGRANALLQQHPPAGAVSAGGWGTEGGIDTAAG